MNMKIPKMLPCSSDVPFCINNILMTYVLICAKCKCVQRAAIVNWRREKRKTVTELQLKGLKDSRSDKAH